MSEATDITPPRKADSKDYVYYIVTGAIIHPIVAGIMSFVLSMLELLFNQDQTANFAVTMLLASGFFLITCSMFAMAGGFFSLVFGIIYNNTAHGKASSPSNRFLYNILFSIVIGIISPIILFILFQFTN